MNIKIEDLHNDCNGTITRKIVCFEKRDNQYFVFLIVCGFDVQPEGDFKTPYFRDKLPLYIIPESKAEEHIKLFKTTFYEIRVIEK